MTERTERSKDLGILGVRVVLGLCFVLHGLQKVVGAFDGPGLSRFVDQMESLGVTAPTISAYAVAFGELASGLAMLVGFFHRTAAVIILIIMAGAILYRTGAHGYFITTSGPGWEYNAALMAMATVVLVGGPGAYAYKMELKKNNGY